ncbi:hypothetical protein CS006_03020 [Bifidobacterium primatium]|uniref:Uncharacterized protein n=1 Tax=Bifidobacterium primatium TaxID=2045438 RepID=A0A2M9HBD1_9BIFI|nr:hypothetical protein [Bifidobacterium primatium]PJM74126.1 hypothetical protein CS006_03020 [Bifidobacterium primatium]
MGTGLVESAVGPEFAGCANAWPQFMQNPESSCRGAPHFGQNLTGRLLPLIVFLFLPFAAAKRVAVMRTDRPWPAGTAFPDFPAYPLIAGLGRLSLYANILDEQE